MLYLRRSCDAVRCGWVGDKSGAQTFGVGYSVQKAGLLLELMVDDVRDLRQLSRAAGTMIE